MLFTDRGHFRVILGLDFLSGFCPVDLQFYHNILIDLFDDSHVNRDGFCRLYEAMVDGHGDEVFLVGFYLELLKGIP